MAGKKKPVVDLTLQVLIEIRDAVRGTNVRLESLESSTNSRFGETNARLDETNDRLDAVRQAQVASEMRLATELVALSGAVSALQQTLKENTFARLSEVERRLADIERKVS